MRKKGQTVWKYETFEEEENRIFVLNLTFLHLSRKKTPNKERVRKDRLCLFDWVVISNFRFPLFLEHPANKESEYIIREEGTKCLKISNIFQSAAFWMGLAGSAGRMRWCRHKKKWVKVEVINFSFITSNHNWRYHTILCIFILKFRRYGFSQCMKMGFCPKNKILLLEETESIIVIF